MKMTLKTSMILGLALAPALVFADCNLQYGGYQSGASTFDGPTVCTGTVDSVSVQGPLTLTNATVNSASVMGPVTAVNSTVKNLSLNGALKATNSNFGTINGNANIYFTASKADSITISGAGHVVSLDSQSSGGTIIGAAVEHQ
jgi:hypothetical protein